jgi:hypothetical protein
MGRRKEERSWNIGGDRGWRRQGGRALHRGGGRPSWPAGNTNTIGRRAFACDWVSPTGWQRDVSLGWVLLARWHPGLTAGFSCSVLRARLCGPPPKAGRKPDRDAAAAPRQGKERWDAHGSKPAEAGRTGAAARLPRDIAHNKGRYHG